MKSAKVHKVLLPENEQRHRDAKQNFVPLFLCNDVLRFFQFYKIVFFMLVFMLWGPLMILVSKELGTMMRYARVSTMIVLSRIILAAILYYICKKRPLAGQGKV